MHTEPKVVGQGPRERDPRRPLPDGPRRVTILLVCLVVVAIGFALGPTTGAAEPSPTPSPVPSGAGPSPLAADPAVTPSAVWTPVVLPGALWASLPRVTPAVPQPSAFFAPRLITATVALDDLGGARLQGRVVDWRGNGMPGVAVRAVAGSEERSTFTRSDGSYVIEALPAGAYAVSVAGYEGLPVAPLPVDGRSIFIVEFIEAARPTTPTATPTATTTPGRQTPTAEPSLVLPTLTAAGPAVPARTPASGVAGATPTPRSEGGLLSSDDLDYLTRTLGTPFLLGAAGGYIIFLLGIFGARLRR